MLERKNCYGYELVNEISKNILISEGTIYPLLRRLKIGRLCKYIPGRICRRSAKEIL